MELIISVSVLVFISLLTILYAYFKYSFEYWKLRNVPCDDNPSMPYGNIKNLGKTINRSNFTKNYYDKYKPTGEKICGLYFFSRPVALLLDLELVKNVLVKDFANFNDRGIYYNEGTTNCSSFSYLYEYSVTFVPFFFFL